MLSHVTVGVSDQGRAVAFYDAVLRPLGLVRRPSRSEPSAVGWHAPGQRVPVFFAGTPFDGGAPSPGNGAMVAFMAPSQAAVDMAHGAGLAAGGTDEGAPGLRPQYGEGYYGAYLRDPDGNKVHVVHRGDL